MRRLASGLLALVVTPVVAIAPGNLPARFVAAATGSAIPSPRPVAPTTQLLDLTAPSAQPGEARQLGGVRYEATRATRPFTTVTASWDAASGGDAGLQISTRGSGSSAGWTAWSDLGVTDNAPDLGSVDATAAAATTRKLVSDPVWVKTADAVRVRSTQGPLPAGLRLTLINGGSSPADAHAGAGRVQSGDAHAAGTEPTILPRSAWGADESLRNHNPGCGTPQYSSTIKVGFVHHTDTSNDYSEDDVPGILRAIYADHVLSNGWCDIGYNFVIDKFGTIWEARYGGVDQPVLGAHTGGFNTDSFGVSLLGNFESSLPGSTVPSDAMMQSLDQLLAWKLGMYGRDALGTDTLVSAGGPDTRYPYGQTVTFNVVSGHRDAGDTTCPGDNVYDQLEAIRTATDRLMLGAALVAPQVATDFSATAAPVVVIAGMLQPGSWQLAITDAFGAPVRTLSGEGDTVTPISVSWDRTSDAGTPVPNGTYHLTLSSTQNGIDAIPWSTNVTLGRSVGVVNQSFGSAGQLTVQGYDLRDGSAASGLIRVAVNGGFNGTFLADMPRSDVAASHPGWGPNHGFDATVPAAPGSDRVCVYGVNVGIPDSLLQCSTVRVPGPARAAKDPSGNPRGALDATAVPSPGHLVLAGWALDPDTRGGVRVDVYVDGRGVASLSADHSRPDIGRMFAGYGDGHGFSTTLNLAGGVHQVCVFAIDEGAGSTNPLLACRSVTLPTGPPHGAFDTATMTGLGKVQIGGWAFDPDTTDPVRIDVYVDGHGATSLQAAASRSDIARLFPMYGAAHGFAATLAMAGGQHSVCAFAINLGPAATNTLLGCRTVSLPTGAPFGAFDTVTVTAPGQVRIGGWAIDPDVADPVRIDVYVDGHGTTSLHADAARPDIARLFPLYGAAHGFGATLQLTGGKHQVCAFAINLAGGAPSTLLGCRTVTSPTGSAVGSFDSAAALGSGQVEVKGWALDPDTAGAVRVDFYVDGVGATSATANGERDDIAKAWPGYGSAHGFDATLTMAAGSHQVCGYAINVGGGAPSTPLGCKAVTAS